MTAHSVPDLAADLAAWRLINDSVMGGVSSSRVTRVDDALRFAGEVRLENNGGFATMKRSFEVAAAGGVSAGFVVQVRGDGNRYRLKVYTRDPASGQEQWFAYFAVFDTQPGAILRIELRWSQFVAIFRGRAVAQAPPIRAEDVVGIGVMITKAEHRDGQGPFALDLLRIEPLLS